MKKLTTKEIRDAFLAYFQEMDHLKIGSSSVVPKNDPTLLFINSGMAPLKKYFLGLDTPPYKRLVNYQPCIRTKDIDDVGDRHHLTLFEMLGSWSIGDYYKQKAVELAYDLLVKRLGFDPQRLYVSVYEGNEKLGLKADEESASAWIRVGIPKDHVVRLGEDNFWGPAGDSGPCGPCTEVFYDCGEKFGEKWVPGKEFVTTGRYIEIWNAGVFMELNKSADGEYTQLPLKSVDTGSGLERMAMIINGLDSVYDTDILKPIVEVIKKNFKLDERTTYMVTDHLRASTFIMAEGVAPSNEGQGYIPRRLLRKCLGAFASSKIEKINFEPIVDKIIETIGEYYPSLKSNRDFVLHGMNQERDEFLPLIRRGIERIDATLAGLNGNVFPGKEAFDLATTFGVPLEVIREHLNGLGFSLDEKGYLEAFEEHRNVSRVVKAFGTDGATLDLEGLIKDFPKTKFLGYETLQADGSVLGIISQGKLVKNINQTQNFYFVTDQTPFYGEGGGQAGDIGVSNTEKAELAIINTLKISGVYIHEAGLLSGDLKVGDRISLLVDKVNRENTRRNHSATHLLHAALRSVVGKHALQKGSFVNGERLRFDFQNKTGLTEEELTKIEELVNHWIMQGSPNITQEMDYSKAVEAGALALFGETYSEKVRVVKFGESVELCGGTHAHNTSEIGIFSILSESSVARGVRRIEAVTGMAALKVIQEKNRILKETARLLGTGIEQVVLRVSELKKKSQQRTEPVSISPKDIKFLNKIEQTANGQRILVGRIDIEAEMLKSLGDDILGKNEKDIIILLGVKDGALRVFVWVKKELSLKLKAGDLLKEILLLVNGKGGGAPHFAQGGSQSVEDTPKILDSFEDGTLISFISKKL